MSLGESMELILERLGHALFGSGRSTEEKAPLYKPPPKPSSYVRLEDTRDTLVRTMLRSHEPVAARVQFLCLDKIKVELGTHWPESWKRLSAVAEKIIEGYLGPEDFFTPYKDEGYLVFFANLPEEAARLKNAVIGRAIAQHLVGADLADRFIDGKAVRKVTGDSILLTDNPSIETMGEWIAMGRPTDEGPPGTTRDRDPGWHQPETPEALLDALAERTSFFYLPLWNVARNILSNHLLMPARAGNGPTEVLMGINVLPNRADTAQVAALDILCLRRAIADMKAMTEDGTHSLVTVPVHHNTLAEGTLRKRWLAECRQIPDQNRRYLIFEFLGLPPGVSGTMLLDMGTWVSPYCRATLLRHPPSHGPAPDLHFSAIHALGVTHALLMEPEGPDAETQRLDAFVEQAEKSGMKSYVIGCPSVSSVTLAVAAGFTYISGDPVFEPIAGPKDARGFTLRDLYRSAEKQGREEVFQ
ncbi:hypothetical protein [Rhodospirillum sp. A1_3_36]|uniref:hypothetical protein n=1 Tax=Rhodospirillum sp. A1_3_36 TaxID=3391666 RepID=UPI0039A60989